MRSELIRPTLESPINSVEDVINRGAKVFLLATVPDHEKPDELNDWIFNFIDQDLVNKAKEENTLRGFPPTGFLNEEILDAVLNNGATALTAEAFYRYQASVDPVRLSRIRQNKEERLKAYQQRIFNIRNFCPWREDFELVIMRLQQSDLLDKIMLTPVRFDMHRNPNLMRFGGIG